MFVKAGLDLGLALFPKAASSSITNALAPHLSEVEPHTFKQLRLRVAFMREPHDRAEAAYRMFKRDQRARGECQHDVSSFSNFIRNICSKHKGDPHVIPQTWLSMYDGQFLPNWIVRWDFDEMSKIIGVRIPHDNAGEHTPIEWSADAREMFDEVYAEDLQLWKGDRCPS